ncbi:MAG: hypothetical protein ACYC1D_11260 [Acidimicrobiales bacterium]
MSTPAAAQTGILVKTRFFVLAWILHFCTPKLHLDGGEAVERPWGETFMAVEPGPHRLRCYIRYLYLKEMGDSSLDVTVAPGQVVKVEWKAPWLIFLKGKWKVLEPA